MPSGVGRRIRYIQTMAKLNNIFNSTVTAFLLAICFCGSAAAQSDVLDRLFDELAEAPPENVDRIEGQIQTAWDKSGSPAMDLLLRRGKEAMDEGDPEAAVDHFTALIDHAPDFAEGYNARATAFYVMGMIGPALDDIRNALRLNPRHFGALRGLGIILEEIERPEDALMVYREIAKLNPNGDTVFDGIERLTLELEGRSL